MRFKSTLLLITLLSLSSCGITLDNPKDIIILYTTDAHCALNGYMGYAAFAGHRDELRKNHDYVITLDCGDFLQGGAAGTLSKGSYITDIMKEVGYDAITIGNHEFDYGIPALTEALQTLDIPSLACNLSYIGKRGNPLSMVKPYHIFDCGKSKVGVIGVTTPLSIALDALNEDNHIAYSFSTENKEDFYQSVQSSIDSCKKDGADYLILLSHLGLGGNFGAYSSNRLLESISGVDAVLDGHSHFDVPSLGVKDKTGKKVPLCTAGSYLSTFGELRINHNGTISVRNIRNPLGESAKVKKKVEKTLETIEAKTSEVLCKTSMGLSIYNSLGARIVRNQETTIGNLLSDAFRYFGQSDIGLINGGAIRNGLPKGDVTLGDILNVLPYENHLCVVKIDGQTILDYLEHSSRKRTQIPTIANQSMGENGGFAQISGLRYTIDTNIPSSVETNAGYEFLGVNGERRVKDVMVLQNGDYVPLEKEKIYTITSSTYVIKEKGDGFDGFSKGEDITPRVELDYLALTSYIQSLEGNLNEKYGKVEGRIQIL